MRAQVWEGHHPVCPASHHVISPVLACAESPSDCVVSWCFILWISQSRQHLTHRQLVCLLSVMLLLLLQDDWLAAASCGGLLAHAACHIWPFSLAAVFL